MGYGSKVFVNSKLLIPYQNGRLPDSVLVTLKPLAGVGGSDVRLLLPAARGFCAMRWTALAAGHKFKPTSLFDSYRPYSVQESTFRARYSTSRPSGSPGSKVWNGVRWYQKPKTAMAAVPGTSNHGKACAVDLGEERDSDDAAESLDNPTLNWLLANEETFGFYHSVGSSEPWHTDWYRGDVIPRAVLDWESVHGILGMAVPETTGEEDDMSVNTFQLTDEIHGKGEGGYWISFGTRRARIMDNDDMQKARRAHPNLIPLPAAVTSGGSKGWPTGPLADMTIDEINRILGPRDDAVK